MENSTTPAPVTPVELVKRQLEGWRDMHQLLSKKNEVEPSHETFRHIEYCAAMIDNFEADLAMLTKSE